MDSSATSNKGKFAVIIPVFNHGQAVAAVVEKALGLNLPVFVVDDGSTDSIQDNLASLSGIHLLRHDENRGKGAALLTGFAEASKIADWAITIDGDGQHHPEDALNLINAIPAGQRPIMVGMRTGMAAKNVPWTSQFGRKFSNFWVYVSGGPRMRDSQSGFRIYPLPEAMSLGVVARRYQFEVEILVRAGWNGIPVVEAPVRVNYAAAGERISHFRPFVDFMRNSSTFTRLILRRVFSWLYPKKME
ncbi:MAG: glycosyltransferase family 2 protein [Desulfobacterales bacterium]|nr:glycosyltransferase family 2 protein [Desulfobacterales bacterium]